MRREAVTEADLLERAYDVLKSLDKETFVTEVNNLLGTDYTIEDVEWEGEESPQRVREEGIERPPHLGEKIPPQLGKREAQLPPNIPERLKDYYIYNLLKPMEPDSFVKLILELDKDLGYPYLKEQAKFYLETLESEGMVEEANEVREFLQQLDGLERPPRLGKKVEGQAKVDTVLLEEVINEYAKYDAPVSEYGGMSAEHYYEILKEEAPDTEEELEDWNYTIYDMYMITKEDREEEEGDKRPPQLGKKTPKWISRT